MSSDEEPQAPPRTESTRSGSPLPSATFLEEQQALRIADRLLSRTLANACAEQDGGLSSELGAFAMVLKSERLAHAFSHPSSHANTHTTEGPTTFQPPGMDTSSKLHACTREEPHQLPLQRSCSTRHTTRSTEAQAFVHRRCSDRRRMDRCQRRGPPHQHFYRLRLATYYYIGGSGRPGYDLVVVEREDHRVQ